MTICYGIYMTRPGRRSGRSPAGHRRPAGTPLGRRAGPAGRQRAGGAEAGGGGGGAGEGGGLRHGHAG